jgi:hypothetical protein
MVEAPFFLKQKGREKQCFTRPLKPKKPRACLPAALNFLNHLFLSGAQADRSYKHKTNNKEICLQNGVPLMSP